MFLKKAILTHTLEFLPFPLHPYWPYFVVLVTLDEGERSFSKREKNSHEILRIQANN